MSKRIALLALSCICLLGAGFPRIVAAQTVRRLSEKDVPVLVNELRVRLKVTDSAAIASPAPARIAESEYSALIGAAVQALHDLNDPTDLEQQTACAAQWGTRDQAGANLRKETQNRRNNLDLLQNYSATLTELLSKYDKSSK